MSRLIEPVRCVCRYRHWPSAALQDGTAVRRAQFQGAARSFLHRPHHERFQAAVAVLRRDCVPAYPVIVRTKALSGGLEGSTIRRKRRFVVFLEAGLSEWQAVEVLIHEWAHALSWTHSLDRVCDEFNAGMLSAEEFHTRCHDAAFGIAFAECYRAVMRPTH
jgi:hypothetical protein